MILTLVTESPVGVKESDGIIGVADGRAFREPEVFVRNGVIFADDTLAGRSDAVTWRSRVIPESTTQMEIVEEIRMTGSRVVHLPGASVRMRQFAQINDIPSRVIEAAVEFASHRRFFGR